MPIIINAKLFESLVAIAKDHLYYMQKLQLDNAHRSKLVQAEGDKDKAAVFNDFFDEFKLIIEQIQQVIEEAKPYLEDVKLDD